MNASPKKSDLDENKKRKSSSSVSELFIQLKLLIGGFPEK